MLKRKTRERLRTAVYFAPLAAFALALVVWALNLPEHDEVHEMERQAIDKALEDYNKKK